MWDPAHDWICERTLPGFASLVDSLLVRGDSVMAGLATGAIEVRSFATWETVRTLEGHGGFVRSLALCGGKLASGSYDRTLKVYCA